jgi:hypothetical protein
VTSTISTRTCSRLALESAGLHHWSQPWFHDPTASPAGCSPHPATLPGRPGLSAAVAAQPTRLMAERGKSANALDWKDAEQI